jgi:hypothetical protein
MIAGLAQWMDDKDHADIAAFRARCRTSPGNGGAKACHGSRGVGSLRAA